MNTLYVLTLVPGNLPNQLVYWAKLHPRNTYIEVHGRLGKGSNLINAKT